MGELRRRVAEKRDDVLAIVRRHRGQSVVLFGSVARGEETSESDVDLLVEFDEGSSLFDLLHMQDELSELLGCSVDVVSTGALKDRDQHLRAEAVPL